MRGCRTLCTVIRSDERLWSRQCGRTTVAHLQPDAFATAATCASALRGVLVAKVPGLAPCDGTAPMHKPCGRGAQPQGAHVGRSTSSDGLHGPLDQQIESGRVTEAAPSFVEFCARMPRAGARQAWHGALEAVAGQSLQGLDFVRHRWRLRTPHTVLLACRGHAVCAVALWEVALRPHGGATAGWLPAVRVPARIAPECVHAVGRGLTSAVGVSEEDVMARLLRPPPPREGAKWLRHVRESLHWACAAWVVQCAKHAPLDDTSDDESVQGLWQQSVAVA